MEQHRFSRGTSVLVVDDNRDTVYSLGILFDALGLDVTPSFSGREAMERMAQGIPDIVIMDIAMPEVDGLHVCRWMREQPGGKEALAIALTGWTRASDRLAAREAGFDHYFVKPADIDAMLAVMSNHAKR